MAIGVLILFAIVGLLLDVVRTWIQRRRTGDSGHRRSARPGSPQWWANLITGLGGIGIGVIAPIIELAGMAPIDPLDHPIIQGVGVTLAALGILATFGAQIAMGASWRIGVDTAERTTLITHGPFRLIRNPIFTAAALTFAGLVLMIPNPIALTCLALLLLGAELQVRAVEEPYLRHVHGTGYVAYAAKVGRFVPGIGRLRAP